MCIPLRVSHSVCQNPFVSDSICISLLVFLTPCMTYYMYPTPRMSYSMYPTSRKSHVCPTPSICPTPRVSYSVRPTLCVPLDAFQFIYPTSYGSVITHKVAYRQNLTKKRKKTLPMGPTLSMSHSINIPLLVNSTSRLYPVCMFHSLYVSLFVYSKVLLVEFFLH